MANYVVYTSIPYEGEMEVASGSLENIEKFIKDPNRGYKLDDLYIYSTDAPDVYELYNK